MAITTKQGTPREDGLKGESPFSMEEILWNKRITAFTLYGPAAGHCPSPGAGGPKRGACQCRRSIPCPTLWSKPMTIAYWCLFAAMFYPFIFAGLAKSRGDFDNANPRAWLAKLSGWRLRAHWAQQNHFEAYPPFAAGVIVAHQLGGAQSWIDALAVTFLLARLLYGVLYIRDRPSLRSIVWSVGFACIVGLFVVAAAA
jgi:uncharacterized MAPEG superfamily protein